MLANDLTADLKLEAERRTTANRIGSAIELGDPQIVFQPIIRLDDQAVVGVECLARFASDRNLSPDLWFADAYKVGLGHQLELLAVRKALACSSDLPADLTVSVNISPATLVTGDVMDALRGFDHRRLIIEVTEHVPIDNYDPILLAIAPIRASGVRVAIDDAGAGYSSLRHILAMRPDIIKFDISLTRGVDTDPVRQAMAAALSEFAQRTRTSVVAEGVETEGEFRTLRDLKFDKGQGYYFGRPQELPDFLRGFAGKLAAHR
jgi:EAL domain-containing protein (putative c-di-GMP-specific phosphodiesterase class I)